MKKNVVISLSGGMDSSTLLLRCLSEYDQVTAISFDYGQKHRVELERAQSLVSYLNSEGHFIKYQVIKLDGLVNLLNSNLVEGGDDVPEGHYIHAGDHAIYPDCRQEFRDADDAAFRIGNWDAEKVGYFTPYLEGDKFDILKDGEVLCNELRLDFNEVYSRTNTSYKPIQIDGEWYSDYKSASSVERIEAFIKLDRPDPVRYADETGIVHWTKAKSHVLDVLNEYENE